MAFMGSGEKGRGVRTREINNYKQGRSGAATKKLEGPVKSVRHNPTKGGGINRATQGRGAAG